MYQDYFALKELPFAITPDPRFLYMSHRHKEALAHLVYGLKRYDGLVQLTGEVGTGKTTLCHKLIEQLPANFNLALVLNPRLDAHELVATICDELKIFYPPAGGMKQLIDRLNQFLVAEYGAGRRTVVLIDEAQNLSAETLEQIRLLTNLETTRSKLLQIVLVGQPELGDLLQREELRQLAQRITARYHLEPLSPGEVKEYVRVRLRIAGSDKMLFSDLAIKEIERVSGGVPRLINIVGDRALLGAYAGGKPGVTRPIVRKAATEAFGKRARPWYLRPMALFGASG